MISDYEKIEFLIEHNYFEHHKVSDIIKDIKFQCIIYLVEDWNINLEEVSFNEYLQSWIDNRFQDSDFIDFLKEQCFEDKINEEYQTIYKKISSFLNQKIAKPKDTPATYFFIKTSKIRFEHTAYKLIKKSIIKLTKINYEALEVTSLDQFKILIKYKICVVPKKFRKFKLKNYLEIYNETDQIMGLRDFNNYLELPTIIDKDILKNNTLEKTLCIEGLSGSGKTTLAQRIGYEVSKENSFYINLEHDLKGFDIKEHEELIKEFLLALSNSEGIIILDNIHRNEITKYITRYFFQESSNLNLKIILVAQYTIKTLNNNIINFFENFFFEEKAKSNLNIIKLSNISNINKIQIQNFFQYYNNKKEFNTKLRVAQLNKLEQLFGCHLSYLKYAFEGSYDCNNIHIEDAKLAILKKYSSLTNLKNDIRNFKLLFCISNLNNSFSIPKKIYRLLPIEELKFIDEHTRNHLIFKLDYENHYELTLPHKSIAKLILDSIKQKQKKQMIEILIDCFDYLKDLSYSFFNTFINEFIQNNDLNDNDLLLLFKYINKQETKKNSLLTYKYILKYSTNSSNIEYFEKSKQSFVTTSNIIKKTLTEDLSIYSPNFEIIAWIKFLVEKEYHSILDFSIKIIIEFFKKDPIHNNFDFAFEILYNLDNLVRYKDLNKCVRQNILLNKNELSKYLTYELEVDNYRVFCNKFYTDEFMIDILIDNLENITKLFSKSISDEKYYNILFTIYFLIDHCSINNHQENKMYINLDKYLSFIVKDNMETILNTSRYEELISFIIEINLYFNDKETLKFVNQIFTTLIKNENLNKLENFITYCAIESPFKMKPLYLFYNDEKFKKYKPYIIECINTEVLELFELTLSDFEDRVKKNPSTYFYLL